MTDWNAEDVLRGLVDGPALPGHTVQPGPHWVRVRPHGAAPLPAGGWKLHISARAATLPGLAEALLPGLLAEGCNFKIVRSAELLARMNNGALGPALVGKAVTIYPDASRVRELGLDLAKLLLGHEGPRILSDRRVDEGAPVYYRYGPFRAQWHANDQGTLVVRLHGAGGEAFDGAAGLTYRQPSWTRDPFGRSAGPHDAEVPAGSAPAAQDTEAPGIVLGDRFRIVDGLYESARGNVYRAVDTREEREDDEAPRTVVVKQARAYVSESADGADVRTRLRNERRVLEACAGVPGIPVFLDHFAHGSDEYLATTDAGDTNLLDRVRTDGAMLPPGAGEEHERRFARLAADLVTTLEALHERGVVMRDITPRNIVLDEGRAHIIDFGLSALDGLHLPGGTPGFAPREQLDKTAPPRPEDDHFALGMVLAFAATGVTPVLGTGTTKLARERMSQSLDAIYGSRRAGFRRVVTALLSREPGPVRAALTALASQGWLHESPENPESPVPPVWSTPASAASAHSADETAARLESRVLDLLLTGVADYHFGGERADFPAVDASLYTGSAGIGLELLHHREQPGVAPVLDRLVRHAHRGLSTATLPPGLFSGRTGTELFLSRARAAGLEVPDGPLPGAGTDWPHEPPVDVINGRAGVGLADLMRGDLAAARGHAQALAARPMSRAALLPGDVPLGTDGDFGYAHGFVGVTDFLLVVAARTGDDLLRAAAHEHARELAACVGELSALAGTAAAMPMGASWCRGLTGAARVLRHGYELFGERTFDEGCRAAALAAAAWVPRMGILGQCCGASGVGTMLVELARATGDQRYREAAEDVVRHLLRRSMGPDETPELINAELQEIPYSWTQGYAGVLTFLRRFNRPETPDLLPADLAEAPLPGTP